MSGWLGEFVQGAVAKTQAGLGDITEGIKEKLKEVRCLSPEFLPVRSSPLSPVEKMSLTTGSFRG